MKLVLQTLPARSVSPTCRPFRSIKEKSGTVPKTSNAPPGRCPLKQDRTAGPFQIARTATIPTRARRRSPRRSTTSIGRSMRRLSFIIGLRQSSASLPHNRLEQLPGFRGGPVAVAQFPVSENPLLIDEESRRNAELPVQTKHLHVGIQEDRKVQLQLLHEVLHNTIRSGIKTDRQDLEAAALVLLVGLIYRAHFQATRSAPGRPEVEEYCLLPAEVRQANRLPIETRQGKVRGEVSPLRPDLRSRFASPPLDNNQKNTQDEQAYRHQHHPPAVHLHAAPLSRPAPCLASRIGSPRTSNRERETGRARRLARQCAGPHRNAGSGIVPNRNSST